MENLFLDILTNKIPSTKIYEDENTFAILDVNPHSKGHLLIIPKVKYQNILDIPENILCDMIKTTKKLASAVKKALNADGVNIHMNNGHAAGQEIMHAHIHVIPRFEGDNIYSSPKHVSYKDGEEKDVAKKIRNLIS